MNKDNKQYSYVIVTVGEWRTQTCECVYDDLSDAIRDIENFLSPYEDLIVGKSETEWRLDQGSKIIIKKVLKNKISLSPPPWC
jgi:hypothetical protein